MKININDMANQPLQRQIFESIMAMILSGQISAGYELPSIRGFARDNQVSVITVQKAYQLLEAEGLIYSRRGKGFYVSPIANAEKATISLSSFKDAFVPLFEKAKSEGLSNEDVLKCINQIIDEKSND